MSKTRYKLLLKRMIVIAGIFALVGILVVMALSIALATERTGHPEVITIQPPQKVSSGNSGHLPPTLRVMSVNLAHGRKERPNQILQSRTSIEGNLGEIIDLFQRVKPDVVALQEADGSSFWSGNFDHALFLACGTPFLNTVRADHLKGLGLAYGTGFLSDLLLGDTFSVTFDPSPFMAPRGFTVASVEWPPDSGTFIDVVSVHLDVALQSRRNRQVDEMIRVISPRERPIIVMGDFNTDWQAKDSSVGRLAEGLDLQAYQPEREDLATFRSQNTRLDWILISKELDFVSYQVMPERISDHSAVVAEIGLSRVP